MHLQTKSPLITVEEASMRNLDPQDPKDLGLMWSIFSKTSAVMENGKRLENLSWRLWNRETLRCNTASSRAIPRQHLLTVTPAPSSTVPELSRSFDSTSSSNSESCPETSDEDDKRELTQDRSKPAERHFTPVDLQNLVHSINEKQDLKSPLTLNSQISKPSTCDTSKNPQQSIRNSSPRPVQTESSTSTVATAIDSPESSGSSNTSVSSTESTHSVIRGFVPGTGVTSYTSKSHLPAKPTPILKSSPGSKTGADKKKKGMFMLGSSSGEEESSLRNHMSPRFMLSKGSQDDQKPSPSKKQTSFKEEVTIHKTRHQDDAVFEDSDEDDDQESTEVSESAIDDDEDAWEDDDVVSDTKSDKEIKFPRVDSKAILPSRRSAIALNLEEERSRGRFNSTNSRSSPSLRRSRQSTPNGPSIPASPVEEYGAHMKAADPNNAKPINLGSAMYQNHNPLQSPRAQRQAMLAGELSESLRKHMLWERQQKNPLGGAGGLKRAHTSADVKNMSQLPPTTNLNQKSADSATLAPVGPRNLNWNHYFNNSLGEYHQNGW